MTGTDNKKLTGWQKAGIALGALVLVVAVVLLVVFLCPANDAGAAVSEAEWPLRDRLPLDPRVLPADPAYLWQARTVDTRLTEADRLLQPDPGFRYPTLLFDRSSSINAQDSFGNCFDVGGGFNVWNSTNQKCYIGVFAEDFWQLSGQNYVPNPTYALSPDTYCSAHYQDHLVNQVQAGDSDGSVLVEKDPTDATKPRVGFPSAYAFHGLTGAVPISADAAIQQAVVTLGQGAKAKTLIGLCGPGITRRGLRTVAPLTFTLNAGDGEIKIVDQFPLA